MSEFVVHSIPGSPFGRAVLIALEEKGAAYRLAPVAPGTTKSPEHLARHPFGRIPVLQHGDYRLFETQAILRYLDRILPEPPLTPQDPKRAGRMDQLMNISDWYLFQGVCNVIGFQRVIGPRFLGLAPDEAVIAAAMPQARAVFGELAGQLGDRAFFTGEALTLADVLIAAQLAFFSALPEWPVLTEAHPNLVAWLGRMEARPSLEATTWERVAAMAEAA
jgi:glutathione S-transferase